MRLTAMTALNSGSSLFICSSPRHLYLSLGLAAQEAAPHLLLIDQPEDNSALMERVRAGANHLRSLQSWPKPRGRRGEKTQLARIAAWVQAECPARIYAGNDRKAVFQYAMHSARKRGLHTEGVYMDDGTGSYESGIHLKFWRGFIDRTVVAFAKKFSLGWWSDRARYLGGGRWVDRCLIQHPDLMPDWVRQHKQVEALPTAPFVDNPSADRIRNCLLGTQAEVPSWLSLDAIIVLPLSKQIRRQGLDSQRFISAARDATKDYQRVGIKYHPRESTEYLPAKSCDVRIPPEIPAEILFAAGAPQCIVGDTSSALLSARWLQSGARILSLCEPAQIRSPLSRLLQRAGIPVRAWG